ncbi:MULTISPECIES: DUF6475 domain-containing protein [Leeia]|uniref:DUF6475 domain-containing protein n=1 Tax=Leeia aquatica TaxID=2725557 RepID=A0A847RWV9_9NEIS|nr:DUF6475 domain-containing protein [Leeia aquatica]NLR74271.1 hypothetical protein [Leeia aquatica]
MHDHHQPEFRQLLTAVYDFYNKPLSRFAHAIWSEAMRPYDYPAVREAFSRHCTNPDGGQWLPKPADIVRLLQGGSKDAAQIAWAKVDRALRSVGTHRSVVFDDPLIHLCIADLGGWTRLGQVSEQDWPYLANRFETLYRGYRLRAEPPAWLPLLQGLSDSHNRQHGYAGDDPLAIGDAHRAQRVYHDGQNSPPLLPLSRITLRLPDTR